MSMAEPVARCAAGRSASWARRSDGSPTHHSIAAVNTFARVHADLRRGFPEVAVEFSAPSVLEGHNRNPLPARQLTDVARRVYESLERELTGVPDFDDLRFIRLDVDRDFLEVRSIRSTLAAIAMRPVQNAYGMPSAGL